ncbi:MAG: hypothetical protein H7X99_05820 [Saprospiraceae bacterium]|nr:hypothetical protein [Saprospiraceae bacterium]
MLICIGWGGYYYFFSYTLVDAFYMTVITIGTVGFGEVPNAIDNQVDKFSWNI